MIASTLKNASLPCEDEYIAIGDVHGCVDELQELLRQNGFIIENDGLISTSSIKNRAIILLGDFVDKGSHKKIGETIEFIHKNYLHLNQERPCFYLIMGNHEIMVERFILEDKNLEITPKRLIEKEKYYNTVDLLDNNDELKEKFLEIYSWCYPWLKYSYSKDFSVTFTHAPCEEQYLAKENMNSYKKMMKSASRSRNIGVKLDKLLDYTKREAKDNSHYHIFGHLSQPNIRQYKNRICIDTSAIYGDTLSCAIIKKDKLSFDSVAFLGEQKPASQIYNLLFDF
ncbi:MAG: metallophosphoesterase [Sulfurovaceae bacterium]|nr:metallophosphoesterase [Sulfurovaceae bacterium]